MEESRPVETKNIIPGWEWLWFLVVLVLGIAPAVVNGFPFYFWDSPNYDGTQFNGIRELTPAILSSTLYQLLGAWALPMINATVFSIIMTRFAKLFLRNTPLWIIIVVILCSSAPFYLSFIMPDIWFVFLIMCFLMLLRRVSLFDFLVSIVACTGHGANKYIFMLVVAIVAFTTNTPIRVLQIAAAILIGSVLLTAAVDLPLRGSVAPERLSWATLGSKIMNDVPEALAVLCKQTPQKKICALREKVAALTPVGALDDQYLWNAGILFQEPGLSLSEFNLLGRQLALIVAREFPSHYLVEKSQGLLPIL